MARWPDETNTGVPDGVILTSSGSITITKDGTVIDALDVRGTINVQANNVTIMNTKVTSSDYAVIRIAKDVTGTVVKNSEINGLNSGGQGIMGHGTFIGNDISGVGDGINVTGDNVLIEGNYIHDLGGTAGSHYDGIQIDGGVSDIRVEGNSVINHHDQTAAVMIDDYFGPTSNVVVNNNLLTGGGYTIYVTGLDGNGTEDVHVTNNHLGKGTWGYTYFAGANPVYSGNVMDGHEHAKTLGNQADSGASEPTPEPQPDPGPTDPAPTDPKPSTGATENADTLTGDAKDNVIDGKGGKDVINGGAGNDTIIGGAGYDTLTGGAGQDVFVFRSAAEIGDRPGARDVITDFKSGEDKLDLSGFDANSKLAGNQDFQFLAAENSSFTKTAGELAWHTSGNRTIIQGDVNGDGVHDFELELTGKVALKASDFIGINGGSTVKPVPPTTEREPTPEPTPEPKPEPTPEPVLTTISGNYRANTLTGDAGNNFLDGKAGNDTVNGGAGNDVLYGGAGRDVMTGGTGNDTFLFKAVSELGTKASNRDVITDFTPGQDKIDLSSIDANTKLSGDQGFHFLSGNNQSFTKTAGDLAWRIEADKTIIQGDRNGDGIHDFEIQLNGSIQLSAGDFVL